MRRPFTGPVAAAAAAAAALQDRLLSKADGKAAAVVVYNARARASLVKEKECIYSMGYLRRTAHASIMYTRSRVFFSSSSGVQRDEITGAQLGFIIGIIMVRGCCNYMLLNTVFTRISISFDIYNPKIVHFHHYNVSKSRSLLQNSLSLDNSNNPRS